MNKEQEERVIEIFEDVLYVCGDKCRLDHNGYCQEHNCAEKEDCHVFKINKLLKEIRPPEVVKCNHKIVTNTSNSNVTILDKSLAPGNGLCVVCLTNFVDN